MTDTRKKSSKKETREDVDAKTSQRGGIAGLLETGLRRFRVGGYLVALTPLYIIGITAMGVAATPPVILFNFILENTAEWHPIIHQAAIACSIVAGYFLYGITLVFVIPVVNFLMPFRLKPFRGGYYSLGAVPWYFHNALTYIVRYTFLEFITPTPMNILFYRMMGMKIGKNVHLNTTNISDPCLIEIGDKVTIGGSAHIIAHYASKGYIIVDRVKIGKGATVGLKATIMGEVEIGEQAAIGPHEVILPKSRIPAGRKPFEKIERKSLYKKEQPSQDFP
jgi:serine acetyltransferase